MYGKTLLCTSLSSCCSYCRSTGLCTMFQNSAVGPKNMTLHFVPIGQRFDCFSLFLQRMVCMWESPTSHSMAHNETRTTRSHLAFGAEISLSMTNIVHLTPQPFPTCASVLCPPSGRDRKPRLMLPDVLLRAPPELFPHLFNAVVQVFDLINCCHL